MSTIIGMAGELGRMTAMAHHEAALLTGEANRTHNNAPGVENPSENSGQQAPKSP